MTPNEKKIVEELELMLAEKDPNFTKIKHGRGGVAMFFIRKIANLQDQIDELKNLKP